MTRNTTVPLIPVTPDILAARNKWQHRGRQRPRFAETTTADEESVWDYPRPPAITPCKHRVTVHAGDVLIADSVNAVRVLETAGAPTIYIPPQDIDDTLLTYGEHSSICEWKGLAQTIHVNGIADAGWRYTQMFSEFVELYLWPSFYPGKLQCNLDEQPVTAQPGGYYGGWVTSNIRGPIKGMPGSQGW